jgi:hypothetical protein
MKRKSGLIDLIAVPICVFLSFFSSCMVTYSSVEKKIDDIAFQMNDYNEHNYYNGYKPSFLSVNSESEIFYSKAHLLLQNNKYVNDHRTINRTKISFGLKEGEPPLDVTLL